LCAALLWIECRASAGNPRAFLPGEGVLKKVKGSYHGVNGIVKGLICRCKGRVAWERSR